jgi:tRNA (guanine37-N1)-methyltransferase
MNSLTIDVLTIFPEMFESFLKYGILKRAVDKRLVNICLTNIRDSSSDRHKTVDDTPYGGGAGMIMKADILAASLKTVKSYSQGKKVPVIYLTPQGKRFDQSEANRLSMSGEFILICGRYRSIDERFVEKYVTEEISVGDFVLSGGEVAAMVVIDAVTRLIPGAMQDFESGMEDSFQDGLLDCPWYTRPEVFENLKVPDELLSGNHALIKKWRQEESLKRTRSKRPDLIENSNKYVK